MSLKHDALHIAGLLPADPKRALKILELCRELIEWQAGARQDPQPLKLVPFVDPAA